MEIIFSSVPDGIQRQTLSKSRKTRRGRRNKDFTTPTSFGTVVPSDAAFIDMILEQRDTIASNVDSGKLMEVSSIRRSQECNQLLSITFRHEVTYRGEPIFVFETCCCCDGKKIWGQSSSCVLTTGDLLKIKISHKCRNAAGTLEFQNTRETIVILLERLLRDSANAREKEMIETARQTNFH